LAKAAALISSAKLIMAAACDRIQAETAPVLKIENF
jgi:hypothetical protein